MTTTVHYPVVSLIIPTKNSSRTLDACIASCQNQSYSHTEIIVVDNSSNDTTKTIAETYTHLFFEQGPERSAQRNYGVGKASGKYVCIIDSDMQLSPDVIQHCIEKFENNPSLLGVVIPEESFGKGFRAQCKKLERSYYVGVDRMEAARCFRKDTFIEMGGYDEKNIGTEDYDLPQRIQEKYGQKAIGRIESFIYHDEGVLSLWRSCQKKFYYGQRLSAYISKKANQQNFEKQSGIRDRYRLFFRNPKKIWENPFLFIGMLFLKTAELGSGFFGYIRGKFKKIDNIY